MSLLSRLVGVSSGPDRRAVPVSPAAPFFAVGDIHGCADALDRLLARMAERDADAAILCVGDYVDRGPDSADVLRRLRGADGVTCLKGNHEHMLLAFLDAPEGRGARWLEHGGLETLASFGVGVTQTSGEPAPLQTIADDLRAAMGEDTVDWLRGLPAWWQSGDVAVVHAGADPDVAIADQTDRTLMWGHPDFARRTRPDGVWVVHGHTRVRHAQAEAGRIAIDTGAYAGGRLTAVYVTDGAVEFLQA